MAVRTYIPIDRSLEGQRKDRYDSVERNQKERYATPIYEIGQVTDFVSKSLDPLEVQDLERKIIVQPYSFDESKKTGIGPPDNSNSHDIGHEDVTSYVIGIKKNFEASTTFKKGDIIEIQIVSNEITKRNAIDGFYVSTLQESTELWNIIEGKLYPLTEIFKSKKNPLNKVFYPEDLESPTTITDEILETKKTVPSYKGGLYTGDIEVITLEGKEVEINTATKYLEMKEAARQERVYLGLTSGYRSMDSQIKIYNSRYEPDYKGTGNCRNKGENVSGTFEKSIKIDTEKGVASYPGCSNHQNGKALDIVNTPRNVAWLRRNAQSFGFYNTVRSENWHWEYIG